jgi:hypothetical protein
VAITAGITLFLVVGGVWLLAHEGEKAVTAVAQAVNPVSQKNVFNRGFNALTKSVTGSEETLGERVSDWMHGGAL